MGGGRDPTLADTDILIAPDGISLSDPLSMVRSMHTRLSVVIYALLVREVFPNK